MWGCLPKIEAKSRQLAQLTNNKNTLNEKNYLRIK